MDWGDEGGLRGPGTFLNGGLKRGTAWVVAHKRDTPGRPFSRFCYFAPQILRNFEVGNGLRGSKTGKAARRRSRLCLWCGLEGRIRAARRKSSDHKRDFDLKS